MRTSPLKKLLLGQMTYGDLSRIPAWEATGEVEDGDRVLIPAKTVNGLIDASVGEVWSLATCRFSNGEEHKACVMCRGDNADGPLGWTVWNGSRDVPLIVPPAPLPVLKLDGPESFARAFGKRLDQVFPLKIEAESRFVTPPSRRAVCVDSMGVRETTQ